MGLDQEFLIVGKSMVFCVSCFYLTWPSFKLDYPIHYVCFAQVRMGMVSNFKTSGAK